MSRLRTRRVPEISRLAWVLRVDHECGGEAIVGPDVEVGHNFIVEGCWNGDFRKGDFARSYSLMGSGVKAEADGLLIATPATNLEALFAIERENAWVFSNSLPLLLKASGAELDSEYLDYEAAFLNAGKGPKLEPTRFPLADGSEFIAFFYCTLKIGQGGALEIMSKERCPGFGGYQEYVDFMRAELKGVLDNAASTARARTRYQPIVTTSTGYDSTFCAALARECGCKEAVVFESKRSSRSDSGINIVARLGYETIHQRHENEYMGMDRAHLFASTGELGSSIFIAAAEDELRGKALLNGARGDSFWDRNRSSSNPWVGSSPYSGSQARTEWRLKVGFLNVCPAFFGAGAHEDLLRISRSPEMSAWTLGNDYDRPIPRRFVEESGVARDEFGQAKDGGAGSTFRFGNLWTLKRSMPTESYKRFAEFYRSHPKRKLTFLRVSRIITYLVYVAATLAAQRGVRGVSKALRVKSWPHRFKCSPFAPSYLFLWALKEVQENEYRPVRKGIYAA